MGGQAGRKLQNLRFRRSEPLLHLLQHLLRTLRHTGMANADQMVSTHLQILQPLQHRIYGRLPAPADTDGDQCIRPLGIEDVTSSMIRNYVKQGLIANPIQKQYSANQIAHLIALALLKQVTPLEYVHNLFRLLGESGSYTDPVAYDYFCEELENILYYRFGLKETVESVGVTSSLEKEMLRSAVTAVSHMVYLNRCFRILEEQK